MSKPALFLFGKSDVEICEYLIGHNYDADTYEIISTDLEYDEYRKRLSPVETYYNFSNIMPIISKEEPKKIKEQPRKVSEIVKRIREHRERLTYKRSIHKRSELHKPYQSKLTKPV